MASRCLLCREAIETTDHLMWTSESSRRVWNMALSAQFSPTQSIASLHELLDHLTSCFQRRHTPLTHQRDYAHMVCAMVAGLWMERNRRPFKEDHSLVEPETLYQEIVSMC